MIGRFANLFKGKDPNNMTMDELFARDQRMYGNSVPDGSFGIGSKSTDFTPRHGVFSSKGGFSGSDALGAFKSLLDVSNAMGDRRQGSYKQSGFSGLGGLFGRSSGTGGMQLSSGPFGTTTYFPDTSSQGYGGYGGEGQKGPTRFAKVAGGAASGALMGMKAGSVGGVPGMAAGAILGGLGGLFS